MSQSQVLQAAFDQFEAAFMQWKAVLNYTIGHLDQLNPEKISAAFDAEQLANDAYSKLEKCIQETTLQVSTFSTQQIMLQPEISKRKLEQFDEYLIQLDGEFKAYNRDIRQLSKDEQTRRYQRILSLELAKLLLWLQKENDSVPEARMQLAHRFSLLGLEAEMSKVLKPLIETMSSTDVLDTLDQMKNVTPFFKDAVLLLVQKN